jgi:hypothetical protein
MASNGLYVTCDAWAPKSKERPHEVSRVKCIVQVHEYCKSCPNSTFVLRVPVNLGNQQVLCPRWNQGIRVKGSMPDEYVQIRRELCLSKKPFEFCATCPNSNNQNPPRAVPGWYDGWVDKKRKNHE